MNVTDITAEQLDADFKVLSPVPRDLWESLTASCDDFVATQSVHWRDAIAASGAYKDISLFFDFPSGRQVLLPMVQRRWRTPLEPTAASWPRRWGVGGPVTYGGSIEPAEATAVLDHVIRRDLLGAEIHLSHISDPVWLQAASQYRVLTDPCYSLDLTSGFDNVWKNKFKSSIRTSVRKAERLGLDVEADSSGRLLEVFYGMYEKSMQRWSAKMHEPSWYTRWHVSRATPLSMLKAVAENFGEDCTTWAAFSGGVPAAALIVLQAGTRVYAWRGAMDKELAAPTRASQLLQKLAIEDACNSGCLSYDLGIAVPGTSLAAAKERLGATLTHTHYLETQRLPVQRMIEAPKNLAKKAATTLRIGLIVVFYRDLSLFFNLLFSYIN